MGGDSTTPNEALSGSGSDTVGGVVTVSFRVGERVGVDEELPGSTGEGTLEEGTEPNTMGREVEKDTTVETESSSSLLISVGRGVASLPGEPQLELSYPSILATLLGTPLITDTLQATRGEEREGGESLVGERMGGDLCREGEMGDRMGTGVVRGAGLCGSSAALLLANAAIGIGGGGCGLSSGCGLLCSFNRLNGKLTNISSSVSGGVAHSLDNSNGVSLASIGRDDSRGTTTPLLIGSTAAIQLSSSFNCLIGSSVTLSSLTAGLQTDSSSTDSAVETDCSGATFFFSSSTGLISVTQGESLLCGS